MQAGFELKDPKNLEATLTLTATVEDFLALEKQLEELEKLRTSAWPLCTFRDAIRNVINDAQKHFYKYSNRPTDEVTK